MTPTPEQIEAVARAICRADGYDPNSLNGWEYQWLFYEKEAVASIAAARPFIRAQALEEAAEHFDKMWGGMTPDDVAAAIRAMIPSGNNPEHHDDTNRK